MMLGLIGLLLLILFSVSSRMPTVVGSPMPGIATGTTCSSTDPHTSEADGTNRSSKLAA
jgi:hypothetical protein